MPAVDGEVPAHTRRLSASFSHVAEARIEVELHQQGPSKTLAWKGLKSELWTVDICPAELSAPEPTHPTRIEFAPYIPTHHRRGGRVSCGLRLFGQTKGAYLRADEILVSIARDGG